MKDKTPTITGSGLPANVVPSKDWRAAMKASGGSLDPPQTRRTGGATHAMLLVDLSGSMASLLDQARRGAMAFARECVASGRFVGLIGFGTTARLLQAGCRDPALIERAFPSTTWGSTALHLALDMAAEHLPRPCRGHAICVVTDAYPDDPEAALTSATRLKALGVDILTIGVEGADQAFLSALASRAALATRSTPQQLAVSMKQSAQLLLGGGPARERD